MTEPGLSASSSFSLPPFPDSTLGSGPAIGLALVEIR